MEPKGIIVPDNISYSEPYGNLSTSSRPVSVRFWTVIFYEGFLFLMNATYPAHEILLDQMSQQYLVKSTSYATSLKYAVAPISSSWVRIISTPPCARYVFVSDSVM